MTHMPSQLPAITGLRSVATSAHEPQESSCSHVPDTELFEEAKVGAYMPQTAARSPETMSMLDSGPVAAPARGLLASESGAPLAKGLA